MQGMYSYKGAWNEGSWALTKPSMIGRILMRGGAKENISGEDNSLTLTCMPQNFIDTPSNSEQFIRFMFTTKYRLWWLLLDGVWSWAELSGQIAEHCMEDIRDMAQC